MTLKTTIEWYTTQEKMPTDKSDVMFVMSDGKTRCGYFYIACDIPHFCYIDREWNKVTRDCHVLDVKLWAYQPTVTI